MKTDERCVKYGGLKSVMLAISNVPRVSFKKIDGDINVSL